MGEARATPAKGVLLIDIRDESVGGLIRDIGKRVASPGGGTVAGLQAALGASLLRMVANHSQGPKFEHVSTAVAAILAELEVLEARSLDAANEDARAFDAVGRAYAAKPGVGLDPAERREALARALDAAADAPAKLIVGCGELVALAEELAPIGNSSVIADVAAAAASIRAAVSTSVVNLEANLPSVKDPARLRNFERILQNVSRVRNRADALVESVRNPVAA
jgi:formiminotetrahydrofolate cyclodeaminase